MRYKAEERNCGGDIHGAGELLRYSGVMESSGTRAIDWTLCQMKSSD